MLYARLRWLLIKSVNGSVESDALAYNYFRIIHLIEFAVQIKHNTGQVQAFRRACCRKNKGECLKKIHYNQAIAFDLDQVERKRPIAITVQDLVCNANRLVEHVL